MIVEEQNAVNSRVTRKDALTLLPALSYDASFWRQGRHHKEREVYRKKAFFSMGGKFWYFRTGLIPRVQMFCNLKDIPLEIQAPEYEIESTDPKIKGIVLRDDQEALINKCRDNLRGIIQAPTGTGKTILQIGIMSCFPQYNILLLAHTIDIVQQTYDELQSRDFENVQMIGGEHKNKTIKRRIVVSTVQSFGKIPPEQYTDHFEVVIVDEAHHVSKDNGYYAKVLSNLLAPIRLGFTATMPDNEETTFNMEGLLGPKIGELTINEATELNILAKPKIRLVKTPYIHSVHDARRYDDVYNLGVVNNRARNRLILSITDDYIKEGKSVLILITLLEHGDNLINMAEKLFNFPIEFVRGSTDSVLRKRIKESLISKEIKCVVASSVWREGINIPTLDVVINACGGKSEIMTLQALGRGLRRTGEKKEVVIVDFFDPSHNFLIRHFGERVTLYMDNNWL